MEGNSSVNSNMSDAYVPTYAQDLLETVNKLADQIRSLESRLAGVDANLSTNLDGLQSVVESQGQSITNETTVRAKLVQGVSDDVADLRSQHIKDHAYTIGLIEDHHGEQLDLFTTMRDELNGERQARELSDERIHNEIKQTQEQSDLYYSEVNQRIDQHDQALDDHTFDSIDWTFDSEDVHFNWSILSAAQEWQLAIGQYLKDAQKQLDDYIKSTEESVKDAVDNANKALENSDIDKILDEMLGKIGSEFLDDALRGELNDYAAQILEERQQRAQDILREANRRIEEIRNLANTIDKEAQERVDAIAGEAKIRAEQIANEAYQRTQSIAEEASKRANEISAAIDASSAAIEAKAKELLTSVDQTIKNLDEGYTKRFTAIEDKSNKTVESLEAYKISNDHAVSAVMQSVNQAVSDNKATLDVVNAFRVEYDSNKATVAKEIKAIADANSVAVESINTLRTDFVNRNKQTDEVISKTKSELISYANSISDAQKATAEKLEQVSTTYANDKKVIDGKFVEVTKSISDANQNITSTAKKLESKFTTDLASTKSEVINHVQTQTGIIDGKVKTVSEKVDKLSGQYTGLSDDLAKNVKNTATAQETANTAVSATESLARNLLTLKAQTLTDIGVRAVVTSKGKDDWTTWRTTGEIKAVQDATALGGYILEMGNNAGNDEVWVHWNEFQKIDPNKLYRVRARYRRVAGDGLVYMGIACKNADKSKYVTTSNTLAGDMGSSNYIQAAQSPALGEWQEVVFYLKGKSAGAATGTGTIENPRTFQAQAEFFAPLFIGNYTVKAGVAQLNYIIIEDADSIASSNDANATAIDLFNVVTRENEATSERTTILETKVTGAEKRIDSTNQRVDANGKLIADNGKKLAEAQAKIESHAKALTTFATKSDLEKSEANQTTQIESTFKRVQDALNSSTDSDSLISDYNVRDPNKWVSHYANNVDPIDKHMITVTDGKIGPNVFRKDPSHYIYCFNYSTDTLPNDRVYKLSMWIRASADAKGTCGFTCRYDKKTGPSTAYASAPVNFKRDGEWYFVEHIWDQRSEENPQLHFGFCLNHTSTTGWAEIQGFKVQAVLTESDVDNTLVRSSVMTNYATKSDLSGAVANATTTLTSQYKTYTDSKAAEVKSAVDANLTQNYYTKAKVDQAIAGEVQKINSSINNVNATIRKDMYTRAETDAAISSGMTQFESNFVLGGVNLFTGGTTEKRGANEYLLYAQTAELSEIYAQGEVTISFDIKVDVAGRVQVYSSNGNPDYQYATFVDVPTTDWVRLSVTTTPRKLATGIGKSNLEFYGTYKTGRIVTVKNVKIEQGRKASAWSPSKGDIDAGFAGALEATNKVSSNLSQNYYTKAAADQAIAAANTKLETKVNNNFANTLKSYYNKTQTDEAIAASVDEFNANLKVGGTNLIKNSNFANKLVYWNAWGTATREVVTIGMKTWLHLAATGTEYFKGISQSNVVGFEPNRDYVISFDAYAVVGDAVRVLIHQSGNGNNDPQLSLVTKVTKTAARYSIKFKSANVDTKTVFNIHISGENAKPYDIYITNIKLELGNTATAWSEATQDTLNAASANATKYTDAAVEVVDGKLRTTATDLTKLKSILGDVQNYTLSSAGLGAGWGGIKDLSGKVLGTTSRGFALTVFKGNAIASHTSYDTYGSAAMATNFVNAVNALADGTYVAVTTYDAIGLNIATVIPALVSLGGSAATLKQSVGRDAYILVGRKGLGEGQGTELFNKANGNVGGKQLDYLLQMVNGIPAGLGSSAPSAEAYNALNTQVGEINGKLASTSTSVTGLQSSMKTAQQGIQNANNKIADTDKRLTDTNGKLADANNRINDTNNKLNQTNNQLSDTDLIARALTNGKLLFADPTFKNGTNSVATYDNARTGRNKVVRAAREADNPTTSGFQLNVTVSAGSMPGYGGFYQAYNARANAVYLIKYIIKLPVGFKLVQASNSMGVGARDRFVGSTEGTGKYETYYRLCQCGTTGPFSNGGHVYVTSAGSSLSGTETMTFQLAQIECYDLTDFSDMTPGTAEAVAKLTEMANTSATETKAMADKLLQLTSSFHPESPNGRMPQARDESKSNLWTYILCKLKAGDTPSRQMVFKDINTNEFIRKGEVVSSSAPGKGTWFAETQTVALFRTWVYCKAAKTVKFTTINVDDAVTIYVANKLQYLKVGHGAYADCSLTFVAGWNIVDVFVGNGASTGGFTLTPALESQVDRMCPVKVEDILDKTSASVLQGYTTQAEMNSAIATASTTLKSEVKADYQKQFDNIKLDRVTIPDTRSVNQLPAYYWKNYGRSVVTEFKLGSAVDSPGGQAGYGSIETLVPWNDASGGPIVQKWTAGTDANTRYRQSYGAGDAARWGAWTSDLENTKVKLTEQAQVIDGMKAVKAVSIDNNGVLCGYALTSELVNGVVRTAFGVDVDTFYVGPPGQKKKFFSIVNGTTYVNNAIIGNLSASSITTGQFTGDRIAARTLKADHLSAAAIDAIAVQARNVTITAPDGSKTVSTGGLTEIFYPNGQLGIRLGIK
ncbi:TPA: carbohydrate binding domain-containing protein [Acinetobacter baumannii]|nr:carbohydrate binding domain-containing protein [Acinetobacter baumannii]HCW3892783.1 carbohydrate binding domain-containing protein [Acinetobacter baumannii]